MTFSLLHFLASHPRNADTLKRALHGDADARRLFSFLGVTPTHLADIDEGAIARRSAAVSVPRTVEMTASASCAARLAEAEKTIKALEARLAQATAKPEQTPPEEVIVLGPWTDVHDDGRKVRLILNGPRKNSEGLCIIADDRNIWLMLQPDVGYGPDGGYETRYDQCEQDAETAARKTYALIDAEPGSLEGSLPRFRRWWTGICAYWQTDSTPSDVQVTVLEKSRQDAPGWEIVRWLDVGETITLAHGPQTGEEGKRYALAAAHALGLTGGDE